MTGIVHVLFQDIRVSSDFVAKRLKMTRILVTK